jgi:hypothetical protein
MKLVGMMFLIFAPNDGIQAGDALAYCYYFKKLWGDSLSLLPVLGTSAAAILLNRSS